MKFLILGCNGMAGHTISIYLKEQGHDVIGFARKKILDIDTRLGDAFDLDVLSKVVVEEKLDSIINCIGVLNQFAEEDKANAVFLNSFLPHFLAKITGNMNTQVIHISTDCVFSGKEGGYTEYSFRDGETFYDRSKALGEIDDDKNVTLRNSIIGPDINEKGIGLLNWFMKNTCKVDSEINGYTKTMWTGQTTLQLAKTVECAAINRAHGIFNMVPDSSISKYELLKLFSKYFRENKAKIIPVNGINADKSLVRTNYQFDCAIPSYDIMIQELADWIYAHKELYPFYNL